MMERELLLLGLLRQGGSHGYQLNDTIERTLAFCADLKRPTAYLLLSKMEGKGWVTFRETRDGQRPPRKVYALTQAGESEFQRLLRQNLETFAAARGPGDVGLAFVAGLNPAEAADLLGRRRAALAEALAAFEGAPPHEAGFQLVIDHHIHYLSSELRWLDATLAALGPKRRAAGAPKEK